MNAAKLIARGNLYPSDGLEGCNFRIYDTEEFGVVLVKLYSPLQNREVIDEMEIKVENIGEWLLNRADW